MNENFQSNSIEFIGHLNRFKPLAGHWSGYSKECIDCLSVVQTLTDKRIDNENRATVRRIASVFSFIEHLQMQLYLHSVMFLCRRTPRRKLVFSSSDDELDNSPQSISSGKGCRINNRLHLWKNSLLCHIFLVHILRQEQHQDEQWVFVCCYRLFFSVWCRNYEVDCLNVKQSTEIDRFILWLASHECR